MTVQSNSPNASREQLIESCQGLVRNLAWKIHQRVKAFAELEDLISYGQVGLAEAADRYDAALGTRFTTYAYHRIRGAIFDGLAQMGWFSRAAFHSGRYERMADELLGSEQHPADQSPTLEGECRWLTDVGARLAVVYLACDLSSADGERSSFPTESATSSTPPGELMVIEARSKLRVLIDALPEQARELIRWTYFEGLSLKEAGARIGISKSWASRLHDRTLRQLALNLREHGLPA